MGWICSGWTRPSRNTPCYPYSNIRYSIGSDLEKGNLYPLCYARMAWDGF